MASLGQYIKKRRVELELTQADIAKKIGVAQNYVTYLENGARTPSNEVIKKLAQALSLPLDRLYFLANPEVEAMLPEGVVQRRKVRHPLLEKLKADTAIRKKHDITDGDIELLASIQARGDVKSTEDYVFLLMTIRQVFQN